MGHKMDFEIETFSAGSFVNNRFHGVAAMHSRREISEKACRLDVVRGGESMSMEEDAIRLQPGLEGSVPFHLPEGKSRVDTDMEADCVVVVVHGVFVGWMTDAVNILGQFLA